MRTLRPARTIAASLRPLLLLASLGACGIDGSTALDPAAQLPGIYHLRAVDGAPLPAVMAQDDRGRLDVTSATRTLLEDGSFSEHFEFRYVSVADTVLGSNDLRGEYTASGRAVVFVDADGTRVEGARAAGAFSLPQYGQTYDYRK
jgi:hypothetical protein